MENEFTIRVAWGGTPADREFEIYLTPEEWGRRQQSGFTWSSDQERRGTESQCAKRMLAKVCGM